MRDGKEIMKIKRIFNFNVVINSDKMLLEIIFIFYDCILYERSAELSLLDMSGREDYRFISKSK